MPERQLRLPSDGMSRRDLLKLSGVGAAAVVGSGLLTACGGSPSGSNGKSSKPIVVGGSLSLTGYLAPGALLHKTAGDLFVDRLNQKGGLLGRKVKWVVVDDQSQNDTAAAAYERLISQQNVDLISGPYGTGTTSAAMNVAQRYGYVFPNSTGSLTYQYKYENQFPSWSSGRYPNVSIIGDLLDMFKDAGAEPKKIAFVINKFPGSNYLGLGTNSGDSKDKTGAVGIAKQAGVEVVEITYPTNISDWAPIAAQIRSANPDFICNYGVGLDATNLAQALKAINYTPKALFGLWSAPSALAKLGPAAKDVSLAGFFLPAMPQAQKPEIKQIVKQYAERAKAAKRYPAFETQAASEWVCWEFLVQAAKGTNSLDNKKMGDWLRNNGINSQLIGRVEFDTKANNYPSDNSIVEQLQNGEWQSVWPKEKRSAKFAYASA